MPKSGETEEKKNITSTKKMIKKTEKNHSEEKNVSVKKQNTKSKEENEEKRTEKRGTTPKAKKEVKEKSLKTQNSEVVLPQENNREEQPEMKEKLFIPSNMNDKDDDRQYDKKINNTDDKEKTEFIEEKKSRKIDFEKSLMAEIKKNQMINERKNEFHTLEVVVLVILTCTISLVVGGLLGVKFSDSNVPGHKVEASDKEMQEFIQDYNYLIDNYYGEIDKKALLNAAFKSMIDTLGDAYSGNIDEASSNNFDIELKGTYEGLGIEIINDSEQNILIYSIIPNSPASKADIKAGDKIVSVNGQIIANITTTEFINTIVKPNDNKKFSIELERDSKRHTIEINKEKIELESVTSKKYVENNIRIGYIKVEIFAENTYEQFKNKLSVLEKEGIDSLIIDLRDNNGGHLTIVSDMISLFLDSSHVIYQTESNTKKEKVYSTGKITKNYPIVILSNESSASASEVMIGALTEEYGAILIGRKTFGKGTVQELHELSNGDEYKFTTKKWLTPKGVWVHNQGITPKVEVTLSKEYYTAPTEANDNQLRAALDYLTGKR